MDPVEQRQVLQCTSQCTTLGLLNLARSHRIGDHLNQTHVTARCEHGIARQVQVKPVLFPQLRQVSAALFLACHCTNYLVHNSQHLNGQNILAQIIALLENNWESVVGVSVRTELKIAAVSRTDQHNCPRARVTA